MVPPVAQIDRLLVTPAKLTYEIATDGSWGVTLVGAGSSELANTALKGFPERAASIAAGYIGKFQEYLAERTAEEQRKK